jgi:hypothetical protein
MPKRLLFFLTRERFIKKRALVIGTLVKPTTKSYSLCRPRSARPIARRSALPRERFSPLALFGHGAMSDLGPLCALQRTWKPITYHCHVMFHSFLHHHNAISSTTTIRHMVVKPNNIQTVSCCRRRLIGTTWQKPLDQS